MDNVWSTPGSWPRDTADYVFLARAVDALGRYLFGEVWNLEKLSQKLLYPLPPFEAVQPIASDAVRQDLAHCLARRRAHQLLAESGSEYVPKPRRAQPLPPVLSSRSSFQARQPAELIDFEFTRDEWARAQALVNERNEEIIRVSQPLVEARSIILEEATMGRLQTVRRPKGSVVWTPIKSDIWSLIKPTNIFEWCQIDPLRPAHIAAAGDAFEWIFVVRDSLERLKQRLSPLVQATDPHVADAGPQQAQTAAQERQAEQLIAERLRQDSHLRKSDAKRLIEEAGVKVSSTGFRDRVWPRAREMAGLSRKAPAGPKPSQV